VNWPDFPFDATQIRPRQEWDSQRHAFLTHGAPDFAAYGYFHLRTGARGAQEFYVREGFLLVLGKTQGEQEPWIHIGNARQDPELFGHLSDLRKLAAVARKKKNQRMGQAMNAMGECVKMVRVVLEKTIVDGQTVYCIDLDLLDLPTSAPGGTPDTVADVCQGLDSGRIASESD
jgi:hypothetical protein